MSERKTKIYRYLAFFMALNILAEVVSPTVAFALTGGPSQPEVESFEPVGTNQMVDLFSGDFNYNIPLLNVPGPNGGYPINMAYHAGIGMEQEASWVGLGWNINAGVVNRSMRGIPDDFNGELIHKTTSHKANWTFGVETSTMGSEQFGKSIGNPSTYGIYYNNFKGLGVTVSHSLTEELTGGDGGSGFNTSLGLNFDSQSGIALSPGISYKKQVTDKNRSLNISASIGLGSRERIYSWGVNAGMKWDRKTTAVLTPDGIKPVPITSMGGKEITVGSTFNYSSYVPGISAPLAGFNAAFHFKTGTEAFGNYTNQAYRGHVTVQHIKDKTLDYKAYGYDNLQNRKNLGKHELALMDFNRSNETAVSKNSPALALPILTNDVYMIKAQGTGGVFRPFRSDVGVMYDARLTNDFEGGELGFETGTGLLSEFGVNGALNYSHSYSGKWDENWDDLEDDLSDSNDSNYEFSNTDESFYFKSTGELTADDIDYGMVNNTVPEKFKLNMAWEDISFKPQIYNENEETGTQVLRQNSRSRRAKRVQGIQYKTREQISQNNNYASRPAHVYNSANANAANWSSAFSFNQYDYTAGDGKNNNHIAEITTVNPDGNRYVYGIPAYNNKQKDVNFNCNWAANNSATPDDYNKHKETYYSPADATENNNQGIDEYFNASELPAYAHSYLLTAIYSPDYVDLTGNGPSEDDFGYYVKFNYKLSSSNYKWRSPFSNAHLNKAHFSDLNDDKASYSYGEKEIWYLQSVETKTHAAVFKLQSTPRNDAYGAGREENRYPQYPNDPPLHGEAQYALEEISLYSKQEMQRAIKTIHFEYDYSLCKNTENNKLSNKGSTPDFTKSGKLTLKKVWFSHLGNNRGHLSPYIFEYNENDDAQNPDYALAQMDRWGNYKPDVSSGTSGFTYSNEDSPYTLQQADYNNNGTINAADEILRNKHAAAWCLSKVILPSGGEINVNYEADDYAFVQDKQATQMFEIAFTGKEDGSQCFPGQENINGDFTRLYFKLEQDKNGNPILDAGGNVSNYIPEPDNNGKRNLYFKTFVELKSTLDFSKMARDYVDGYAEIVEYGIDSNNPGYGYIKLASVPVGSQSGHCNPIQKAAWQYMKLERPDLLYPVQNQGGLGIQAVNIFLSTYKDRESLILSYYRTCKINGYAKKLQLGSDKPSYIRLLSPDGRKFGGGHRVKSIVINDKWSDISGDGGSTNDQYGQEYGYALADGRSSGVAEYEPTIGGEENPLHKPTEQYDSQNGFLMLKHKDTYMEEPFGEAYFPAANVGYSRVSVKSLGVIENNVEVNSKTASGISLTEYYTAKDFPVKVNYTGVTHKAFAPPIPIPIGIGSLNFNNRGYSQGYAIELNDMHGKIKSQSAYAREADINSPSSQAISETKYIYNSTAAYNPNALNSLSNSVTVLDNEADYRTAEIGVSMESFVDMQQHDNFSVSAGLDFNLDVIPVVIPIIPPAIVPFPFPTFHPRFSYDESMFRSVVYNKIIYRTGILMETRARQDASEVSTKNLMFDAETGKPVLTSVTNDFEAPVYNYEYAAHWAYPKMGGMYKSMNAAVFLQSATAVAGTVNIGSATHSFQTGDQVDVYNGTTITTCWIDDIDDNTQNNPVTVDIHLIKQDGSNYSGNLSFIQIVRPANTNQQSIGNGKIVSLTNPVTSRTFELFDKLNLQLASLSTVPYPTGFQITNCLTNQTENVLMDYHADHNQLSFAKIDANEHAYCTRSKLTLPAGVDKNNLQYYRFYKVGETSVKIIDVFHTPNQIYYGTWEDIEGCYKQCLDGVLHADASHFNQFWNYNYPDVNATVASTNPYVKAEKGIWRNQDAWVYQVDRKQGATHTDIAKDGTYKNFVLHNWNSNNPEWTFVSAVSKYNPYGFEIENVDALGIYSSALYGYGNSVTTAVSANASYHEIAYDGFEDHGATYQSNPIHGHLLLSNASLANKAHTGKHSLQLNGSNITLNIAAGNCISTPANAGNTLQGFAPVTSTTANPNRYIVSAWFKQATYSIGNKPIISISGTNSQLSYGAVIDGWQKAELVFEVPTAPTAMSINFGFINNAGGGYLDDVRIQPYKSSITTYVYDPVTLWLVAELDNRNFATFYNYDSEGSIVQVKKETEKGIVTLKTSRNSTKRNLTQTP